MADTMRLVRTNRAFGALAAARIVSLTGDALSLVALMHSLVPDKAHESENSGDIKLYGRANPVSDPAQRRRYEQTIEARINWYPPEPYHCFAFNIERAGMVRFSGDYRLVWSWREGQDLVKRQIPASLPE